MKTQIIHRVTVAVIAVVFAFITYANKLHISIKISCGTTQAYTADSTSSSSIKEDFQHNACFTCFVITEHSSPAIPLTACEHEFHVFNVKHHQKHIGFWRNVTNKLMKIIYGLVGAIADVPYKLLVQHFFTVHH